MTGGCGTDILFYRISVDEVSGHDYATLSVHQFFVNALGTASETLDTVGPA